MINKKFRQLEPNKYNENDWYELLNICLSKGISYHEAATEYKTLKYY